MDSLSVYNKEIVSAEQEDEDEDEAEEGVEVGEGVEEEAEVGAGVEEDQEDRHWKSNQALPEIMMMKILFSKKKKMKKTFHNTTKISNKNNRVSREITKQIKNRIKDSA